MVYWIAGRLASGAAGRASNLRATNNLPDHAGERDVLLRRRCWCVVLVESGERGDEEVPSLLGLVPSWLRAVLLSNGARTRSDGIEVVGHLVPWG